MVQCRMCGSKKIEKNIIASNYHGRHLWGKEKFQIYLCKKCACYFLDNIESEKDFYKKYYPKEYLLKPSFLDKFFGWFRKNIVENNPPVGGKKIRILDIGCGNGNFLESLNDKKFEKFGVEIKNNKLIPKNIKMFLGDINKLNFGKEKFDVITAWHVLEHLPNPSQTLLLLNKLLNKSGKIFLAVPNSNCLGFKIGKEYCFHLDSPRHLFVPNKINLKKLLIETAYKNIKISNLFFEYPLDLWWSIRNSGFKFLVYPLYPLFKLFSSETILVRADKI